MILATTAAVLLIAQQAGAQVEAEYPEQGWELEYPALIGGFVDEYYTCLKGGSYVIGDDSGFEAQYRGDILRCGEKGKALEADSNRLLASRSRASDTPPASVAKIFETVRRIHVERGASLDRATSSQLVASDTPPVDLAAQAECIARVNSFKRDRQTYADSEGVRVEALYAKPEYTDEDRRAIMGYHHELQRLTSLIEFELKYCPAAAYAANSASADGKGAP